MPVYERLLYDDDPLTPLLRLFLLNVPVPEKDALQALAGVDVDELIDAGLVERDGDALRAPFRLGLYRDLLVAHDPESHPTRADFVLGPGPTAEILDHLTVRRPVDTFLDVGTGSGIQALRAARHARHVVGVDINARALQLAAVNAELNGITNIEWRLGDLYEPVAGERFDEVVANPPFVISPGREYEFRDSGLPGDAISRAVVEGVAEYLVEGGTAHVLSNWALAKSQQWDEPPRRWVDGRGCDLLAVLYESEDSLRYAARWNDHLVDDPDRYGRALDEWLDYHAELGIDRIVTGAVALRRTAEAPRVLTVGAGSVPGERAAAQIERIFAAGPRQPDDTADLLDAVFEPVSGLALQQQLEYEGQFTVGNAAFYEPDGIGVVAPVAPVALHVVLALEGTTALGDLIDEVADDDELDGEALRQPVLEAMARLAALGLVQPASP